MFLRDRLSWKSVLGLLVLAALGCGCYLFFNYPKGPVTVPQFEQWVDGSLPPGMAKNQVEAWLESQSTLHDYAPGRGLELPGKVQVYFFFDEQDKLIRRVVTKESYSF